MGHILTNHTMVAAKLLISLCLAGLVSAAPQNQGAIVNDVVVALQPSIASAVAEALRGLQGTSSSRFTTTSSSSTSGSRNSGSSFGVSGSRNTGLAGASGAAVEGPTARPEYNYEYKVADDVDQTYISQNEARDGDDVVGTYSYVDPNGDLVTVNYQAGLNGYTQTLDKQVGAVEMRARPVRVGGANAATSSQSSRGSSSSFSTTSSSRGLDQSALIAQIIAALQPQIASAVN